jgi:hypothetical protein
MLDLETLGTKPGCVVLEVGAVAFDPHSQEFGGQQHFFPNQKYQRLNLRGEIDAATLDWWLVPERRETYRQVQRDAAPFQNDSLLDQLAVLSGWIREFEETPIVWAMSPSFDCAILGELYDRAGLERPWRYSRERDVRTALTLSGFRDVNEAAGCEHNGAHRALNDCRHQVQAVRACYTMLRGDVEAREQCARLLESEQATRGGWDGWSTSFQGAATRLREMLK